MAYPLPHLLASLGSAYVLYWLTRRFIQMSFFVIPQSHYCEIARWALKLGGVRFVERPFLPGIHMFFSPIKRLRARVGKASAATPLVAQSGRVLADSSWACLALVAPSIVTPIPPDFVALLDADVGPTTRSIIYSYTLTQPMPMDSPRIPRWQRFLWSLAPFQETVRERMREDMVRNEEHVEACRGRLRAALATLEPLLTTECFSLEVPLGGGALALAALLAPVTWPPGYPSHGYTPPDSLSTMPEGLQREVREWRATAAGRWVMEAYPRILERVKAAGAK